MLDVRSFSNICRERPQVSLEYVSTPVLGRTLPRPEAETDSVRCKLASAVSQHQLELLWERPGQL
jgi:hypothetical protein